jgi:hypothetical protein
VPCRFRLRRLSAADSNRSRKKAEQPNGATQGDLELRTLTKAPIYFINFLAGIIKWGTLVGAKALTIEDPYNRAPHQIANFVRFCETEVRTGPTVQHINLITGYDEKTDLAMVRDKLAACRT